MYLDKEFVCEKCGEVFYQTADGDEILECPYCGASKDNFVESLKLEELEELEDNNLDPNEDEDQSDNIEDFYNDEDNNIE